MDICRDNFRLVWRAEAVFSKQLQELYALNRINKVSEVELFDQELNALFFLVVAIVDHLDKAERDVVLLRHNSVMVVDSRHKLAIRLSLSVILDQIKLNVEGLLVFERRLVVCVE